MIVRTVVVENQFNMERLALYMVIVGTVTSFLFFSAIENKLDAVIARRDEAKAEAARRFNLGCGRIRCGHGGDLDDNNDLFNNNIALC